MIKNYPLTIICVEYNTITSTEVIHDFDVETFWIEYGHLFRIHVPDLLYHYYNTKYSFHIVIYDHKTYLSLLVKP